MLQTNCFVFVYNAAGRVGSCRAGWHFDEKRNIAKAVLAEHPANVGDSIRQHYESIAEQLVQSYFGQNCIEQMKGVEWFYCDREGNCQRVPLIATNLLDGSARYVESDWTEEARCSVYELFPGVLAHG